MSKGRISLKNNVCICCNINRTDNFKNILCKNCMHFVYDVLELRIEYVSSKLHFKSYTKSVKKKCSFCDKPCMIKFNNYNNNKKYYICKSHYERWLKIGCELGEFSIFLNAE